MHSISQSMTTAQLYWILHGHPVGMESTGSIESCSSLVLNDIVRHYENHLIKKPKTVIEIAKVSNFPVSQMLLMRDEEWNSHTAGSNERRLRENLWPTKKYW